MNQPTNRETEAETETETDAAAAAAPKISIFGRESRLLVGVGFPNSCVWT